MKTILIVAFYTLSNPLSRDPARDLNLATTMNQEFDDPAACENARNAIRQQFSIGSTRIITMCLPAAAPQNQGK